jgi:hypothetical protein
VQLDRRRFLLGSAAFVACGRHRTGRAPERQASVSSPVDTSPLHYDLYTDLSRDGARLVLGAGLSADDSRGPIIVWDVARRTPIARNLAYPGVGLEGRGLLRFARSGKLLVACVDTNAVALLDATSPDLVERGYLGLSYNDSSPGTVLLRDEREILTSGEEGIAIAPTTGRHDVQSKAVRWLGSLKFPFYEAVVRDDGIVVGADPQRASALDPASGRLIYTTTAAAGDSDSD